MLGFLRTRRFGVWLGDGQNAVADVEYSLTDTRRHFVFNLRTTDSRVRGGLTILGPRPEAVLENNRATYWQYQDGVTSIEINPSRAYTWLASKATLD